MKDEINVKISNSKIRHTTRKAKEMPQKTNATDPDDVFFVHASCPDEYHHVDDDQRHHGAEDGHALKELGCREDGRKVDRVDRDNEAAAE